MKIEKMQRALLVLAALLGAGCSHKSPTEPPPKVVVTKVSVSPSSATISIGAECVKTKQLTATVTQTVDGAPVTVSQNGSWTYTSGITVDGSGLVTANAVGTSTATFTASVDQSKTASAEISVTDKSCVVNTLDSMWVNVLPDDSLAASPDGLYAYAAWTKNGADSSAKVAITTWNTPTLVELPIGLDSIKLVVRGGSVYYPNKRGTFARPAYVGKTIGVTLKSRCWLIRTSSDFAGSMRCLAVGDLLAPAGSTDNLSFYLVDSSGSNGKTPHTLIGWAVGALPVVSLNYDTTTRHGRTIDRLPTTADSLRIDTLLARANSAAGMVLAVQGPKIDTATPPTGTIEVSFISGYTSYGNWVAMQDGTIHSGFVQLSSNPDPDFFQALTHELLHALGFGHTCKWNTRMFSDDPNCDGKRWEHGSTGPVYTVDDVAAVQMAYAIRASAAKSGDTDAFWEAYQGHLEYDPAGTP